MNTINYQSLNKTGKSAAILTLAMIIFAPFSMMVLPSMLIVPGDAAATAANIVASETLLRLGIASGAIVFLIEIFLVALLYELLKPVNKTLSLVAAFARLGMTVIQGINLLNYVFPLLLLGGDGAVSGFLPGQSDALALLFLQAYTYVSLIWGLFFALHLMVLGYLVYKSGYINKFVGLALMVASLCYFVQSFGMILLPQFEGLFANIGLLSTVEIAFPLWLLIKGIKDQ